MTPRAWPLLVLWVFLAGGCASVGSEGESSRSVSVGGAEGGRGAPFRPSGVHLDRPLARRDVDEALRGAIGRLRECYESRLKQRPDLVGTLSLDLVVAPEGRVSEASVARGSARDGELDRCVLEVVRSIAFPSFQGDEVEVEIPLRLTSE